MPVLVDSNVILDIVTDDPVWADWADDQITKLQKRGLVINSTIFAELCVGADHPEEVEAMLSALKIGFMEPSREALFRAAKAFLAYRKRGGVKTSPLPDFFIGAQAETLGIAILTRDISRYKTCFPKVDLICP
jgi:predicted nucleic acid-binding protein